MKGEIMTCQVIVTQEENWFVATDISTNVASQGETIIALQPFLISLGFRD